MTTIGEERIALEVAEIPEALKAAPSDPEAPIAGEHRLEAVLKRLTSKLRLRKRGCFIPG